MKMLNPSKLNEVLIVRIGKIGDIIVTSFVFEVIKENNPLAKVSLITKESNRNVLRYNLSIDNIYYIGSGLKRYFQLFLLRNKKFDLIIDFNDNPSKTSKLIFSFFKAKIKCGYDFPLYSNLISFKVPQPEKTNSHIIERMKHFLETLGYKCDVNLLKPFFYIGKSEENEVLKKLIKFKNQSIITINISAGAEIRFWKTSNWIELIERISKLDNKFVFILLSAGEDKNEADKIFNEVDKEKVIKPGLPTFQHFAACIKNSQILISPDTSAVHVAEAYKIPVIALYPNSEWNFASWRPFGTPNRALHSFKESVNAISVDQVFNSFVELNNEIIENG